MIFGWRNKPEWVRLYQERDERRARAMIDKLQARVDLEHERESLRLARVALDKLRDEYPEIVKEKAPRP